MVPPWADTFSTYVKRADDYTEGRVYLGGTTRSTINALRAGQTMTRTEEEGYGAIQAIDPKTGDKKWEFKMNDVTDSGVLTTASDLLFAGGREGYFFALNARTGALLWKAALGGQVANGPIAYAVNGREYVAVAAGSGLFTYALRQ